jgi:hypothetical protein
MGTDKNEPPISRTVLSPGDDPKHELVVLMISRAPPPVRTRILTGQRSSTMSRMTKWREPEPTGGIFDGFTKMEIQTTGHTKGRIKQRSKKMVLGKRRGRGPGSRLEEPASGRMSKAVARFGARPRHKSPLPSGKVKRNTNVRPGIVLIRRGTR